MFVEFHQKTVGSAILASNFRIFKSFFGIGYAHLKTILNFSAIIQTAIRQFDNTRFRTHRKFSSVCKVKEFYNVAWLFIEKSTRHTL